MLLAIDVGNTHTVVGLWDGSEWAAVWRRATSAADTEDQLAVWLKTLFDMRCIPFAVEGMVCASVVPALNQALRHLGEKWLHVQPVFLESGTDWGLPIEYRPPTAVGADRIANALAALAKWDPPIVVVDFGTATTFDAISVDGTYVGGAILPGVQVSADALFSRAAKLPPVEFRAPDRAIGQTTVDSLQSGIMHGYAGAVDALADRIGGELSEAASGRPCRVVATGGLGKVFFGLCRSLEAYEPNLTLDGLVIAFRRHDGSTSTNPRWTRFCGRSARADARLDSRSSSHQD